MKPITIDCWEIKIIVKTHSGLCHIKFSITKKTRNVHIDTCNLADLTLGRKRKTNLDWKLQSFRYKEKSDEIKWVLLEAFLSCNTLSC